MRVKKYGYGCGYGTGTSTAGCDLTAWEEVSKIQSAWHSSTNRNSILSTIMPYVILLVQDSFQHCAHRVRRPHIKSLPWPHPAAGSWIVQTILDQPDPSLKAEFPAVEAPTSGLSLTYRFHHSTSVWSTGITSNSALTRAYPLFSFVNRDDCSSNRIQSPS